MKKNELYHHGILGQKWGIRRFQNYDGTLIKKNKELTPEEQAEKEARKARNAETRKKVWEGAKKFASVTFEVAKIAGSIYLAKQLSSIMAMEVISTGNRLATAGTNVQMMQNGLNWLNDPKTAQLLNQTTNTLNSANNLLSNPNVTAAYQYASNPQTQSDWMQLATAFGNAGSQIMTSGAQAYSTGAAANVNQITTVGNTAAKMAQYYQNMA